MSQTHNPFDISGDDIKIHTTTVVVRTKYDSNTPTSSVFPRDSEKFQAYRPCHQGNLLVRLLRHALACSTGVLLLLSD